ncbi:trimeric intracellular cation channel family protein [Arcticibacter tournemirensis]|uniref:Trimeric intracellular cation channel family protein n=1 Tax=Arcticibacter tournemirensis TaxID=699437 RepID=A0A5M9HET6_9SPHI|nr:trimeric intracellular cation channel family protein [Arcticibacter tournemirensis]KAA8485496.1 trimeric intracellular cation channel family protein [Arcticibacter tournemirensis]
MEMSVSYLIELLGVIVFTISGAFSAMQKRFDAFGVLIIGFVTALGGGTIRDVLIGYTPVSWMRTANLPLITLVTGILTIFFKQYIKNLKTTFIIFDAVGLGLFTMIGIQRGVAEGLSPEICIILGTITGSFGGVLRDILLNNIPQIFRKEIYATACIVGGIVYFLLISTFDKNIARLVTISLICGIRLVAVRYNLSMPKFYA